MRYSDIPNRPRNLAPSRHDLKWPEGKQSALYLSFDFDAEAAWFDEDPGAWRKEVSVSHGGFGPRVGVPKILELLRDLDLKATFFTPAWTVTAHTAVCEAILKDGHEIGHHGAYHRLPGVEDRSVGMEEIALGFDTLQQRLGVAPAGYRAPLGENDAGYLEVLQAGGVRYSSSWRDDVFPYRHVLENGGPGPIELPANYFFDDWMHGLIKGSGRNLVAREQVLSMWLDELEVTHEWGGLTTTILHPQVSGRPSRFKILREFLTHAAGMSDLWIANGVEICDYLESNTDL